MKTSKMKQADCNLELIKAVQNARNEKEKRKRVENIIMKHQGAFLKRHRKFAEVVDDTMKMLSGLVFPY